MPQKKVIVYGGNGALGSIICEQLKAANYWVLSIDFFKSTIADENVLGDVEAPTLQAQADKILPQVENFLGSANSGGQKVEKVEALISAAGGWAGGNVADENFLKNVDLTVKQSVWSSAIAAKLAFLYVKENGLLILPGAAAALDNSGSSTAGMIGYGANKAAVHHMVKCLGSGHEKSGLPKGVDVIATLPITIDTPMNRRFMADADFGSWTKREFISELLINWMENKEKRPENGSLVKFTTAGGVTSLSYH